MFQTGFGNNNSKQKRSIVSLIEGLQNIAKHGKYINNVKEGVFYLSQQQNMVDIEIGNFIDEKNYQILNILLSRIKAMSLSELTNEYQQKLISTDISENGNASLGLLEMARNSNNNFSYNFNNTGIDEYFYNLKINF